MKYTLMHREIPVADIEIDDTVAAILKIENVYAPEHFPVGTTLTGECLSKERINEWWKRRAIPASRSGLQTALEKLGVPYTQMLLLKCYGLSLSDQYWINPVKSSIKWSEINFFDNVFSNDIGNILFGQGESKNPNLISPDCTSDGWLKKKWKIIDNKRCLIKGGSMPFIQEPLNEVFASLVCKRLNIPHVNYSLLWDEEKPYSACEDFIDNKTDLVSTWQICNTLPIKDSTKLYNHFVECCNILGISGVTEYLDEMLSLDYLIVNTDRHFGNFGVVRNAKTLEWVGFAPMYDNGTSFWHNTLNDFINPEADLESFTFKKKHREQLDCICSFDWLDLSALEGIEEKIYNIYSLSPYMDEERCDFLTYAFRKRVEMLNQYIQQRK